MDAELRRMMDRLDKQRTMETALVDAYNALRALPAIVDDDYPEAAFKYGGALDTFFQKAIEAGFLAPNTMSGLRLPHNALLRKAAQKFRLYQSNHERKFRDLAENPRKFGYTEGERTRRMNDTQEKAKVNAELAGEIEDFLAGKAG